MKKISKNPIRKRIRRNPDVKTIDEQLDLLRNKIVIANIKYWNGNIYQELATVNGKLQKNFENSYSVRNWGSPGTLPNFDFPNYILINTNLLRNIKIYQSVQGNFIIDIEVRLLPM